MFCLFTDPIINNRICNLYYILFTDPLLLFSRLSPFGLCFPDPALRFHLHGRFLLSPFSFYLPAATLHDFLFLKRTYSILCLRVSISQNHCGY